MSKVLITEQYLTDIADAIREKLGVQTQYKPSEMAAAILSIPVAPIDKLELAGESALNSYTHTFSESGTYLCIVGYPYSGSASLTFSDATVLDTQEVNLSGNRGGFICKIVSVEEDETATMAVTWASWAGRVIAVIKLTQVTIDENVKADAINDTSITYTLPNDDNYYLVYGFGLGRTTGYYRDDTTGGDEEEMLTGTWGGNSVSRVAICKGSDSPSYSFYGYDGGVSAIIAWRLA